MRILATALLSLAAASSAAALPFSDLILFGDSLTDTGNVTEVYATVPHPIGAPATIPGPPYDPQGRASNGLLYADRTPKIPLERIRAATVKSRTWIPGAL